MRRGPRSSTPRPTPPASFVTPLGRKADCLICDLRVEFCWEPEQREKGGVGEAGDLGDRVAVEREDHQAVAAVDPGFAVEQVGGEGGLPVRARGEEPDLV